jgi:hypothetical protein
MHLCRRALQLSSDDLACPAILLLLFRAGWVASVVTVIAFTLIDASCLRSIRVLLAFTLLAATASGIVEIAILCMSLRGTIANDAPRRYVPTLCAARTCLAAVEIAIAATGVSLIFCPEVTCGGFSGACRQSAWDVGLLRGLITIECTAILVNAAILGISGLILLCSTNVRHSSSIASEEVMAISGRRWAARCRWIAGPCYPTFCGSWRHEPSFYGVADAYIVVGEVMASVLELVDTLELTLTDVAAGL